MLAHQLLRGIDIAEQRGVLLGDAHRRKAARKRRGAAIGVGDHHLAGLIDEAPPAFGHDRGHAFGKRIGQIELRLPRDVLRKTIDRYRIAGQPVHRAILTHSSDFDIVAALKPVYDPAPEVDDGKLLVQGYFPTEPKRVYFSLGFIPSDGEWKLFKIDVNVDDPK